MTMLKTWPDRAGDGGWLARLENEIECSEISGDQEARHGGFFLLRGCTDSPFSIPRSVTRISLTFPTGILLRMDLNSKAEKTLFFYKIIVDGVGCMV